MKDLKAPGLCGLIYDDVLSKAFRPIPEISALMSLALVSAATSREVLTLNGYHTNIHAVGIAPTAAGKDIIVQYFDISDYGFIGHERQSRHGLHLGKLPRHTARRRILLHGTLVRSRRSFQGPVFWEDLDDHRQR